MLHRRARLIAVVALAAAALTACSPAATEPTPSPTVLTEDEAYAQAEAAFRAYIDAQNAVVIADPATFEPVFDLTTGEANAYFRKQYSGWHANGWSLDGSSHVTEASAEDATSNGDRSVDVAACIDVSEFNILDAEGEVITPKDREDNQSVTGQMERGTDGAWRLALLTPRSSGPPCSGS